MWCLKVSVCEMYVLKIIKFQKLTLYSLFGVSLYFLFGFQDFGAWACLIRKDSREAFLGFDHSLFTVTAAGHENHGLFMLFDSGGSRAAYLHNKISVLYNKILPYG